MGTPVRRKTNSESCQRRLLSSSQAGEEGTSSGHSLFSLNNAHLNSGSNGIGGLPELPRIAPPLAFSMPFYNFGYGQLAHPIEWTATPMPVLLTEQSTSQVYQQPSSLLPVETPLQIGSSDPLPEAVPTGELLDSSDSQVCNIGNTEKLAHNYPDVIFVRRASDKGEYLEISQRNTLQITGAGYVSVVRAILFDSEGGGVSYDIQVLLNTIQTGTIGEFSEAHGIITMISQKGSHKFCPGLDYQQYFDHYLSVIRYNIKSVRLWERPFYRVDSVDCELLHQLPRNATAEEKDSYSVLCKQCKRLRHLLNHQRRRSDVSPSKKLQRQQPSSHFKVKYLSPASALKRRQAAQQERSADKAKITKYESLEVTLDDDQSDELSSVIDKIEEQHQNELDKVFQEADARSKFVGDSLRDAWLSDRNTKLEFFKDQQCNSNRKKGSRWSPITIRVALAVFIRSPAAYEALKSFNILSLPSRSTIQAYTGAFLHEAGASHDSILKQVESYELFKEACRSSGKRLPKSDGVLIFDEVKVVSSLIWNSRNHQLIGLAMSETDQASLQDIYQLLEDDRHTKLTNYILQFLWRDLTSSFDVVGPYFTSEDTVTAKFISACVFETIQLFQVCGLKTSLLICDGAAPNLTFLKATHGVSGMYGVCDGADPFEVKPWFINPFNPPHYIYWLICPSHQLKNMVNALYASQEGGTRTFEDENGVTFGWKSIIDMFARECQRRDSGHARMVPKLREVHIIRDSWTKLNVFPAKIMQQEQVLTELHSYVTENPSANDVISVKLTLQYLEACRDLFEEGFLSHKKITTMKSEPVVSIHKGFSHIRRWHEKLSDGAAIAAQDTRFLSWQTWDLLRVCVYGFTAFATWFLDEYPDHFISPVRLSGSAIETLFSQFKGTTGGKLSAMNYSTARAAHLVKHAVTPHHSSKGYRDVPLDLGQVALEKKKYERTDK